MPTDERGHPRHSCARTSRTKSVCCCRIQNLIRRCRAIWLAMKRARRAYR
jgi:hypothetical protein